MGKVVLGLDLGSNSIGWALLEEVDKKPARLMDLGCRIFPKAVEEKTPTPKNVKRRNARLARRVIQRRARRKQRMLNYLVSLHLLPAELQGNTQPEILLNDLGDPYQLRARALDQRLSPHELGRVFLHLVQRRGFLSNRKTLLGDMVDDPDVLAIINELDEDDKPVGEEGEFKQAITVLRQTIKESGSRTLGEYLSTLGHHDCKRNRKRDGSHLRTDRQMYREELDAIWQVQAQYHAVLTGDVKEQIESIIFFQRPLKLKEDRVGKCSLERQKKRAQVARLEYQRFRYLQDINNLQYFDVYQDQWIRLSDTDREKVLPLFEDKASVTYPQLRKALGLDRGYEFNLEQGNKKLKGNITACDIRKVLPQWDELTEVQQLALVEDLLTIQKKSVLKKRLMSYWGYDLQTAVDLCLLEFEPGYGSHSLKAIRRLLPFLEQGLIYSDARQQAGYGYEVQEQTIVERLGLPPEIPNPIVSKALHELRRVMNAIIAEYGKPDAIRIEMARDLEMNTKRYKAQQAQQKANTKANEVAEREHQMMRDKYPHLKLSKYASRADKLRHRLWKDQNEMCAYSGKKINLSTLFSAEVEVDHILPYSESLDDSYMNKVVCLTAENRVKGQKTPIDAFGGNADKWNTITHLIAGWNKKLTSKRNRFYMTAADVQKRDFLESQLNDTRYISRVAHDYLKQLGADISVTKGIMTGWLRHQWHLDSLIGLDRSAKDRTDHRHHAIDAVVTACIDRGFYQSLARMAKSLERERSELHMRDLHYPEPWETLRDDLEQALDKMIVSHVPQRKLSGALHEETGAGFIEGIGTVYRVNLSPDFKVPQVKKIIDDEVRQLVADHLEKYGNKPKEAFAEGITLYHKDGKTPIKRVRVVQSKTTLRKLEASKFGIRNRDGDVFRWMAYGNLHHVEILRQRKTGKYKSVFVTALEAAHRVRGIGQSKQPMIQLDHGDDLEFVMALHINDLVSIADDEKKAIYRVQKIDSAGARLMLRLHTAATLNVETEQIFASITTLMSKSMALHSVNAIGKPLQ